MIVLLAMCCIVTGCINNEKTITLLQIKDLFKKHGIPLVKPIELNTDSVFLMTLNEVTPEPFIINDEQIISIYVYSSSTGVKKGIKDFEDNTATADVTAHGRYQVANVLIFYNYEGFHTPKDERVEMVVTDLKSLVK